MIETGNGMWAYRPIVGDRWADGMVKFVPEHMWPITISWILLGEHLSDEFFRRMLVNDFMGMCAFADAINRDKLWEWANFWYNYSPMACKGSLEKVNLWRSHGGMLEKK